MRMKTMGLLMLCAAVVAGCKTQTPGWTETTLGMGRYAVDVPHITAITGTNSNPTIWIHECGKIVVRVNSFEGGREGDIWINWIDGTVTDETTLARSNTAPHPIAASAAQGERHRWVRRRR